MQPRRVDGQNGSDITAVDATTTTAADVCLAPLELITPHYETIITGEPLLPDSSLLHPSVTDPSL